MPVARSCVMVALAALAGGALVTWPAQRASAATTVAVPASIPADCSADVSASLGSFLNSVPNDTQIDFPSGGCYRVEAEIDVTSKSNWVIHGHGSLLKRTQPTPSALQYPHANAFLRFINLSNSSIDGLNILGINTVSDLSYLQPSYGAYDGRYPFDHGYALEGATNVVLSDAKIDAVYGDGVYISGGDQYTGVHSNSVTMRDITVDRNGRQGMSVSRSSHVVFDGVNIEHSRRSGIDLEPDSAGEVISNIEIKNSRVHSWLLAFAAGGPGAVNDISIHDNTVTGSGVPFIYDVSTLGVARSNWLIANNRVTVGLGSPQPAMKFANTTGVVIKGNYVPVATTQSRLEAGLQNNTTNAQIICNQFPGAGTTYISADNTSSFIASGNTFDSTTAPSCDSGATATAQPVASTTQSQPSPVVSPTGRVTFAAPSPGGTTTGADQVPVAASGSSFSKATASGTKPSPKVHSKPAATASKTAIAASGGTSGGTGHPHGTARLDYSTAANAVEADSWFGGISPGAIAVVVGAAALVGAFLRRINRSGLGQRAGGSFRSSPVTRRVAVATTDVLPKHQR